MQRITVVQAWLVAMATPAHVPLTRIGIPRQVALARGIGGQLDGDRRKAVDALARKDRLGRIGA